MFSTMLMCSIARTYFAGGKFKGGVGKWWWRRQRYGGRNADGFRSLYVYYIFGSARHFPAWFEAKRSYMRFSGAPASTMLYTYCIYVRDTGCSAYRQIDPLKDRTNIYR